MTARIWKGAITLIIFTLLIATPATAAAAPGRALGPEKAPQATTWLTHLADLANQLTAWWAGGESILPSRPADSDTVGKTKKPIPTEESTKPLASEAGGGWDPNG